MDDVKDKEKMKRDVKVYFGLPLFDGPSNYVANDRFFKKGFKKKYGISIEQARKNLGLEDGS